MQVHERKAARKNPLLDAEPGVPASVIQALAGSLDDAFLLEATATQYRTTLGRLEGDGRFRSALRADRSRFRASRAGTGSAPGFALLAPLGVILELLVEEKQLLTGSEHEIVPAVHTFENLVDELHPLPSPSPEAPSLPRRIGPTHNSAPADSAGGTGICRLAAARRIASRTCFSRLDGGPCAAIGEARNIRSGPPVMGPRGLSASSHTMRLRRVERSRD